MSLETILKKAKNAVIAATLPLVLLSSPVVAQNSRMTTNNYRVNAEELSLGPISLYDITNFASARYMLEDNRNEYTVTGSMAGEHSMYHSRMRFRVEGNVVNDKYMPRHYEMVYTDDSIASSDGTTTTIIDFDYQNHKAYSYSYNVDDGRRRDLYDTRPNGVNIDDSVKDMISAIMDLRNSSLNSSMQINTIIWGRVKTYTAHYEGNQAIRHNNSSIECSKYKIEIPSNVIDSYGYRFTFWITQSRSRTPLRMRIQPGNSSLIAILSGTTRQ